MEIIHIILGKANPERMNGVNKVVYQLATAQVEHHQKVRVWGITKDAQENFPARNFNTRLFQKKRNPFGLPFDLKKAITQTENVVFHLHGGWIPLFWSIAHELHRQNKRFVLTPHGAYNRIAMRKNRLLKNIYFYGFEKKVLEYAYKIHCIGTSEKWGLEKIYPNTKQWVIPYGFTFSKPHILKEKENTFIVGFVGRLDIHTKGLDLLVEAFDAFAKNKHTALWIIGDSAEKYQLQARIKSLKYRNKIKLWGSQFGDKKQQLIQQMSVFIHPSRNEGLPTAVLEAAASGIPCVVTKATNVGQYVTKYETGLVVENEDIAGLVDALHIFYQEWLTTSFTHYHTPCIKMLQEEFNWTHLIKKYNQLYS